MKNENENENEDSPPKDEWFKLNTDGSILDHPRKASADGVIRNSLGRWVKGFRRHLGPANNLIAKLWRVREWLFGG